ncbi:hypothetical protein [Desertibacillus haloalkaliphilus]|uniref:hypothetical protein n=1 Tax=Desertibacillus haloalkaliphilus TaxID=1328930 RepID=UPI001C27BA4E|nr:hypothetical protein [Desertibacillus haloalkaliphilus]MBU8905226.1 hypothetical protein [Desertibacillus haloalkaliphilus]
MQTIQLAHLIESISPRYLSLLKRKEQDFPIVLRDGLSKVKEDDVKEIIEAVIMENGKETYLH